MSNHLTGLFLNNDPPTDQISLCRIGLPIALGLAVGVMIGLDPLLGYHHPLHAFGYNVSRCVPYLLSLTLIVLLLLGYFVVVNREGIFSKRYSIAIILLVLPGMFSGLNYSRLDPTDPAFLAMFIFWIMASLVEHRPFCTPLPITCLLLSLTAFLFASVINGLSTSIIMLHMFIEKVVFLFLITNIITTARLHRFAMKTFVAGALLSALVGIVSEFIYWQFGYPLTFDDVKQFWFKETPFGKMLRVSAFLPTTQGLGHLSVLAMSIVLFMPISQTRKLLYLLVLGISVGLTFSVGAYLMMGLVLGLSVFIRRPERSLQYAASFLIIALLIYTSGMLKWIYKILIVPLGAESTTDRIEYIRVGLNTLNRYPIVGIGLKNINKVLHTPIHNAYLQMAAEIGIMGGLIFALMVFYLVIRSGLLASRLREPEQKNWVKGLSLGMFILSIHFLSEPFYDSVISWMYMGLVASAIVSYARKPLILGEIDGKLSRTACPPHD